VLKSERMKFEILGEIKEIEMIASGKGVKIRRHLECTYGKGHWRKMKGIATVQLENGMIVEAEIHWFEAMVLVGKILKSKGFSNEPVCSLYP